MEGHALNGSADAPFSLRPLDAGDLDAVCAIEAAARPWTARWPRDAYLGPPGSGRCAWVAVRAGSIAGFVLTGEAAGEVEILNLAVAESARRTGVGEALVGAALNAAAARGATRAFLEVRVSNAAAIAFYAALRFEEAGRRRGYYSDPQEDALLLALPLAAGPLLPSGDPPPTVDT